MNKMRKIAPLLLAALFWPLACFAAISQDTFGNYSDTSGTTNTATITIAGTNRYAVGLVAAYSCGGGVQGNVSTFTADGNTLTLLEKQVYDLGGGCFSNSEIWGIVAPPTGSTDFVVTYDRSMNSIIGTVVSLNGVKQTGQPDAAVDTTADPTMCTDPVLTNIVTDSVGAWIFDVLYPSGGTVGAPGAGQTEYFTGLTSRKVGTTATTYAMTWAFTGCNAGLHPMVSIAEATVPPSPSQMGGVIDA